jgi:hypothetical protein
MPDELNDGRVAYLEARVGELHQTIADLRDGWREADQQHARYVEPLLAEVARLRREVEFEACGADTFSGADAAVEGGDPTP